jgi:predicted Rossmann-fold nucleotide-binding protein
VKEYFTPLLATLKHAVQEGFIFQEHLDALICKTDPEALLDEMSNHRYPHDAVRRWMREG